MDLRLHNTLTGRKEKFEPLDPDCVTMYVCGPTVYGYVHIGNGRPAVVFDVLFRLLSAAYPRVRYARNITDVDDKINAMAIDRGEDISELTEEFTLAYREDVGALGNLEPTVEPRATHHIGPIIEMIATLMERGHAYAADGHVLFSVPSDPTYGTLSNRSLEDMLDGARVEVAPYKQDPKDFVLWKPSSAELPGWDSPWGRGRPGWHIECSAMIRQHLGDTIDIHGGGSDLTFPHHENELAQSVCATDDEAFVRFWLHNGMLTMANEKMSKSLGNIVTIRQLLETNSGEVLRYSLLSGHYRSPLAWSNDLLQQAQSSLDRLYQALLDAPQGNVQSPDQLASAGLKELPDSVVKPLTDDLNTPQALAALHALASEIHKTNDKDIRSALRDQLLAGGWLLGLFNTPAEDYFQSGDDVNAAEIDALIAERNEARAARNFERADAIRDELAARDIELEDTAEGTRWKHQRGPGTPA